MNLTNLTNNCQCIGSQDSLGTGIYHVMMRGINHQAIFEDEEDYYQFINILDRMRVRYDDEGIPSGSNKSEPVNDRMFLAQETLR